MRNRIALSLILAGTLLFGVQRTLALDSPPTPQQKTILTQAEAFGYSEAEAMALFDQAVAAGISEESMLSYLANGKAMGMTREDIDNLIAQKKSQAAEAAKAASGGNGGAGISASASAGIKNMEAALISIPIENPLGGTKDSPQGLTDIRSLLALGIKAMLGLIGSIALLMFVYGGFLWLTSRGNSESVAKGSKTMTWAALGIALIFSSYALVEFIFKVIGANGT